MYPRNMVSFRCIIVNTLHKGDNKDDDDDDDNNNNNNNNLYPNCILVSIIIHLKQTISNLKNLIKLQTRRRNVQQRSINFTSFNMKTAA